MSIYFQDTFYELHFNLPHRDLYLDAYLGSVFIG